MELPDEMLVGAFVYLSETDLHLCKMICRRWNIVANDIRLIHYFKDKGTPLPKKIVDSCEQGRFLSFQFGIDDYCSFNIERGACLGSMFSIGGTHDLWVRCMIAAAKGGHTLILQKVLRYGPTYGFHEAKEHARMNGHLRCVELLERECIRV